MGSSTSSRWRTGIVCRSLDFDARSTRRTCGGLDGAAEEDAQLEEGPLRLDEEVAGLLREHDDLCDA